MERRNADDWDGVKLEVLAKTYMGMRREIWQPLADITGEKWTVVEAKVCLLYPHHLSLILTQSSACPKDSKILEPTHVRTLVENGS